MFISCEIENNPTEILSLELSDSVTIQGDTIKLYVDAYDSDDDKISYNWKASNGEFLAFRDTAYWIAPRKSGIFNITCKVSDGVGSSDAEMVKIKVVEKIIRGQVLNAMNGNPISDAMVNVENFFSVTNELGNYILYMSYNSGDRYSMVSVNELFCPFNGTFFIPEDFQENIFVYNLSLSPAPLEGQVRLVLNWGAEPEDLDTHLKTPMINGTAYHILYSNKGSSESLPYVKLDIDNTSGYGPETLTINQLYEGTYKYYIYQFSSDATLSKSNAIVNLYNSPNCEGKTIVVPDSGVGRFWYVCDIDGSSGEINIINNIQPNEPN